PMAPAESRRQRTEKSSGATQQAKPLRVLLIEDSPDIVRLMKTELESLGYSVLTASEAEEAMQKAPQKRPEAIVSDIKMPGMDGYELLRNLRAIPEVAATPAIALTGLGRKKDLEDALSAGFQAMVCKPVEARELSEVIQKLVEK